MNKKLVVMLVVLGMTGSAGATSLVYTPVNPSFGGNPANGAVLLNEANAQNGTHAPTKSSANTTSSTTKKLDAFTTSLQNAILQKLSTAVESEIIGPTGKIIPGVLDTSDFTIRVVDNGNGSVNITTIDKATGETSSFDISQTGN